MAIQIHSEFVRQKLPGMRQAPVRMLAQIGKAYHRLLGSSRIGGRRSVDRLL